MPHHDEGVAAATAAPSWQLAPRPVSAGCGQATCLLVGLRRERRTEWHLMAVHHGELKIVFTSADQREFAQVCRALRRALESRDDRRFTGPGSAAA